MQIAAAGIMDFRKADVLDPKWWIKLRWMIDQVNSNHCVKIYEHRLQQRLALLPTLTDSTHIERCWNSVRSIQEKIVNEIAPWVLTGRAAIHDIVARMKAQYTHKWGDPDSPEHRAELDRLRSYWHGENQ